MQHLQIRNNTYIILLCGSFIIKFHRDDMILTLQKNIFLASEVCKLKKIYPFIDNVESKAKGLNY